MLENRYNVKRWSVVVGSEIVVILLRLRKSKIEKKYEPATELGTCKQNISQYNCP